MDIIRPDGSKYDPTKAPEAAAAQEEVGKTPAPEAGQPDGGAPAAPPPAAEPPAKPPLWGQITNQGIMQIEVNLAVICGQQELIDQFMGFMERHKSVALVKMMEQQKQRALIKAAVQKTQMKNGHRGLMDRIFRGGR